MSSHLSVFVPSYGNRIMNSFVDEKDGFHWNAVRNQDTDTLYIFSDHFQESKEVCSDGNNIGQRKESIS